VSQLVESALDEFQRYLGNEIAPNAIADSLGLLMAKPPDVLMQRVATWAADEHRKHLASVRELLLFAMTKIYVTGELQLLDREAIANYLDRVTGVCLRICPDGERDQLRNDITDMRRSNRKDAVRGTTKVAPIPVVQPEVSAEEAQAAKRFSLIFDRLSKEVKSGAAAPDQQEIAQLLTMAAMRSQNGQQLNQYLEQLKPLAGGKEGNIFVILGGAMPSWDVAGVGPGSGKPPTQVGAIEKIIDLAETPAITEQRFRELVSAAIEKFNQGAIAATLWMLGVAEDTITEKKMDLKVVDNIRSLAVDTIDAVQLRKYAENKSKHGAVRFALEFFPTLRIEQLFAQLRGERAAERRRRLLGFIEAYGVRGREMALDNLEKELARSDGDTYYLRNLIYLLHRIAREQNDTVDREFAALAISSAPGQNIYVIKEAATAIGQFKTEAAVKILTTRLAEFEVTLLRNDTSSYPAGEMQKLLDRLIGALARIGTTPALLTVARHGMKANPSLGDTRARLASLAQHDLSFDAATVEVLLKALREEIPGKLLGRLMPKNQDSTVKLIEALSCTVSDDVDDLLRDIAQRFTDQLIGKAATSILAKRAPVEAPPSNEPTATLVGELEFFGLPSVMQSLADMRATGMLTLTSKVKQVMAKVIFIDGKFANAQTKHLRGADAMYEVLERPAAGSFAFVPYPPERFKSETNHREVVGLVLEGIRRNDELQQMIAVVPDEMTFSKTEVKPTPHEEETDPAVVREVWMKAASGIPVLDCEKQLPVDGYRVRRLLSHWLEQGALVAK
jgi:hypothetical protein